MNITIPGLDNPVGLGDVVKSAASAIGKEQTPDCKCAQTQRVLSDAIQFIPPRSEWADLLPPCAPPGWGIERGSDTAILFLNGRKRVIWEIADGRYARKYSFCCGILKSKAHAKFEELCQTR